MPAEFDATYHSSTDSWWFRCRHCRETSPHASWANEHACPTADFDPVSVPKHYNSHPSGVECIEITKHMNYCLGNVIKYVWRAGLKGEAIEDLEKAATYLQYEIERLRSL